MRINTSVLKGAALDWAVAKCEGVKVSDAVQAHGYFEYHFSDITRGGDIYSPSNDWVQGGVIIERECISLFWQERGGWMAGDNYVIGGSPLEAAMRCYEASKLGNEVDLPDELVEA